MKLNPCHRRIRIRASVVICRAIPCLLFFVAGTFAQTAVTGAPGTAESTGPKIEFASPIYDFGKVKQGEVARHDFVFKNTGTSTLEITAVNPGCGCTTAGDWDKRVEPGKTGVIPLQLNSAGFSGGVNKSANVTTNDPRQQTVNLQMKGEVWTPFAVSPTMAVFTVSSETETSETKVVRIVSQIEEDVTLTGVEGATSAFRAELIPVKPGKEFELKITTVPPFPSSSVSAPLTVKTSSTQTPTISVLAQLVVQQPVVVTPERITLPAGPLSGVTSTVVTIRNNGKSVLALSDATMSVPGGVVTVQEVQAGKLFQVTVKFPSGYVVMAGELPEVSVKSNHPKFPVIRVPVVMSQPPTGSPTNVSGVAPKK